MKIIQKGNGGKDIVKVTLENRNIDNLELFLNPDSSTDSDPFNMINIMEGINLLNKHVQDNNKICTLVDQDADGYMSSSLFYNYIRNCADPNLELGYILHDAKAHGLTDSVLKKICESGCKLIVIPDAGSNDTAQIEQLIEKGVDVLVIDHHQVTSFTEKGVIINNQLCDYTNKNLVGVGMVYKFLQAIDSMYEINQIEKYLDLVAVGQIGDASNIADNEIRNLVLTGLDNIQNEFLKVAIGQKNGLGVELAPKDLSFGVIPLINAVTRMGESWEREILFKALAEINEEERYEVVKKKKNKDTGKFDQITFNFDIYEYAYEVATKCKARQDAAVKKMVAKIDETLVDDAGVIIAFTENNDNPGITGLVANKIMSKYDKPVLLLNKQEETFTGSGRGHEKTLKDFRSWCEKSEVIEFAQGHDNAFGFCIRQENLGKFKEYSRKIKKQDIVYEVDLITDKPDKIDCQHIENNKRLFGGAVSEPFIGLVGLSVPKKFISVKGSMLTIFSWGVSIVQFSSSPDLYEEIMNYPEDSVRLNIVGYYSMNNWNGRLTPQFIVKDIEVEPFVEQGEVTVENIVF